MTLRRAARRHVATACPPSLRVILDGTAGARVSLPTALQLAHAVTSAVADLHDRGATCGPVEAGDFELEEGTLHVRPRTSGGNVAMDVQAVGSVLFHIFTGVTVAEARAQTPVPRLHEPPSAARLNPALDDALETLLLAMMARDPAQRPNLTTALERLGEVMEDLDVSPVLDVAVPIAAPAPVRAARPLRSVWVDQEDEGDDDDEGAVSDAGVRFDGWALLACCFAVASLALAASI